MDQDMTLIADFLLVAGALGAAFYCLVLSRRLSRFTDLDRGVGGAVAALSAQVDDLTRTLESARGAATSSAESLDDLTRRAETVAKQLELFVASMHDLPTERTGKGPAADSRPANPVFGRAASEGGPETANAPVATQGEDVSTPSHSAEGGTTEKIGALFLRHRATDLEPAG